MSIPALVLLLAIATSTATADRSLCVETKTTQQSNTLSNQIVQTTSGEIKITIAAGGAPYRPVKNTFRVGEPVPLVITFTNTGSQPVYICESSMLYQNRPLLLKDGKPIDYTTYRQSMMQTAERDKTCRNDNLPQQVLLSPNEPVVVDWFNLAEGRPSLYEDGWYEPLPVGKYTLTDRRRLTCCDGPFIESNTISFEVIP